MCFAIEIQLLTLICLTAILFATFSMVLNYTSVLVMPFKTFVEFPKWSTHLPEVAGYFDIMPRVVVELSVHWFHNGFKGSRAQVDNEGDGTIFQRQVDVISRLARVEDQTVALPGLEG